jgi:hypothetical protein
MSQLSERWLRLLSAMAVLLGLAAGVSGQSGAVSLRVAPEDVGLTGQVQPGQWTGMRLTLEHRGGEPRPVVCRWLVSDRDGDRVLARRELTLNPNRTQQAWLYAPLPAELARQPAWTVQVLSNDEQTLLATTRVGPRQQMPLNQQPIGVMATTDLGLTAFTNRSTRHEAATLLRGLKLENLPDRWYGLATLSTLIWTPQGGKPADIPDADVSQALRDWVRRGGHLVLSLPAFNRGWGQSDLAELLPVGPDRMRRRTGLTPPSVLGPIRSEEPAEVDLTLFDPSGTDATVLARSADNNPFIVTGRHGLGRVTLIGIDLTDRAVRSMGLPFGKFGLWHRIFRWQAPVMSESVVKAQRQNQKMNRPSGRQGVTLDKFLAPMIAMRNTAAPMLLGAIIVFLLYWLLAGPVTYFALKHRGLTHYSWLGFLAVVLLFLGVSWGGALSVQGDTSRASHFSVLTAHASQPSMHARSWLSLRVPRFGKTTVTLGESVNSDSPPPAGPNTLAAPGLARVSQGTGFADARQYTLDAADPHQAEMPFRATAKQLQLDYFGRVDSRQPGITAGWGMPTGELTLQNHWPVGELGHGLPSKLHDVLMVYCPGEGEMPFVWRHGDWPSGTVIDIGQSRQQNTLSELVKRPSTYGEKRNWEKEGFLGQLVAAKAGQQFIDLDPMRFSAADSELIKAIELLSFFQALPPPNFRKVELGDPPIGYERTDGRALDLTHLTQGRRLLVIGYLKSAPLPAPLTVDQESVPSEGWTVVRWIYDFEAN